MMNPENATDLIRVELSAAHKSALKSRVLRGLDAHRRPSRRKRSRMAVLTTFAAGGVAAMIAILVTISSPSTALAWSPIPTSLSGKSADVAIKKCRQSLADVPQLRMPATQVAAIAEKQQGRHRRLPGYRGFSLQWHYCARPYAGSGYHY
jgi:hypothetical protein